ncbi:MAG: hypothetical protein ACSLFQ_02215 [Thermoanaerobaculia bacterium]
MREEPSWPKRSRTELVELARRILKSAGSGEQIEAWAEEFEAAVLMPDASMLLLWPENHVPKGVDPSTYEPNAEEIVERVLAYQPIILGPGKWRGTE